MLKIQVVSHGGRPLRNPLEVCLDETGGTMGRLATNQIVLPDPERHVSRIHARILHRPEGYFILHQGSNPIVLNGATLRIGDQAPLGDGDELSVCAYRLRVAVAGDEVAERGTTVLSSASPKSVARSEGDDPAQDQTSVCLRSPETSQPASEPHQIQADFAEAELAPGEVDFALDVPPMEMRDAAQEASAELFFSWETDMDLYRVVPGRQIATGDPRKDLAEDMNRHSRATATTAGLESDGEGSEMLRAPSDTSPIRQPNPVADTNTDTHAAANAALEEALQRFSPEQLEQRLKHRTMLDSVLSINRKAKLWDLFTSAYGEIAQEVREEVRRVLEESLKQRASGQNLQSDKEGIES